MSRRCRYCQQVFQRSPAHPHQLICSRPDCQRQRRREYHRRKLHTDAEYHQVCRDSQEVVATVSVFSDRGFARPAETNEV